MNDYEKIYSFVSNKLRQNWSTQSDQEKHTANRSLVVIRELINKYRPMICAKPKIIDLDGTRAITCPKCKTQLDPIVNYCSHCGQALTYDTTKRF